MAFFNYSSELVGLSRAGSHSQVEGPWTTEKYLSVTMVSRQEKFLGSRRFRMAKTVTFWLW